MDVFECLASGKPIVIWGCGKGLEDNIDILGKISNIKAVCDIDTEKQGKIFYGINCVNPRQIDENDIVIITIQNCEIVNEIKSRIKNCAFSLEEIRDAIIVNDEDKYVEEHISDLSNESEWNNKMVRYIGINVPATTCNLKCSYCYVRQQNGFYALPKINHSPKYIRWCLSQKRIGGQALIVLCGAGETLLCDKIIDICIELLHEGHYLHIVTNGTVTSKIKELVERAGTYKMHLLFKFSFHYLELQKQNLLSTFADNVRYVDERGVSYTVELTASDDLVSHIDKIKQFSYKTFGALPHVTIARDDTKESIPILTDLEFEEYHLLWSSFDSELFNVKWRWYSKKIHNCHAGQWSLYINLLSGDIMKCYSEKTGENIYDRSIKSPFGEPVKDKCRFAYCYNNHLFLTLGIDPSIRISNFVDVRDRIRTDGSHWVKEKFSYFINQKLYENNKELEKDNWDKRQ